LKYPRKFMNKRILLNLALILCMLTSNAFGQDRKEDLKNAEEFALNVSKAMIERECDTYFSYFNDTIVLLRQKIAVSTKDFKDKFYDGCVGGVSIKNDSVTFAYYLENFERKVYNSKEIKKMDDLRDLIKANEFYQLKKGDFLYVGFHHKTGNYNDYLVNDSFCFIFRKVGNGFKILVFADV